MVAVLDKNGQPWQRILHGDSRDKLKALPDAKIKSIITDPPFGVDNKSNMAKTTEGKAYARKIANDEDPETAWSVFDEVMQTAMPKMDIESDIYIFTSYQVLEMWLVRTAELFGKYDYRRKAIGVWQKDGPGMGDLETWGMGMEFILYYKRGNRPASDARRNMVLHVPQVRPNKLIHPHEKPAALLQMLMKHSTDRGELVVDPFGGSGSLARAARSIGRTAISIEEDKYNYKLAKERLEVESSGFDWGEE